MVSALLAVIAVCMLGLAVTAARRHPAPGAWLVALICVGLAYDSAAIAVGQMLGAGPTLEAVNAPRYWIHAVLTPLMVIAAAAMAIGLGVTWLARRPVAIPGGLLVLVLIGLGVQSDVFALGLEPQAYADTVRYVNAAAGGPPVPAILTIVLLIAIGALIWRRAGVPWLCLGAIAMFAAAAAGFSHFWIGNLGELALQIGVMLTLLRVPTALADRAAPAPAQA